MLSSLVYTELLKYKRTFIPWMIAIAGILTTATAVLLVSYQDAQNTWAALAERGFDCMNSLALILAAVIAGHVYANEYHEGTAGILFTYPVSRFKIHAAKQLVILLMIFSLYLCFFLSTLLFGWVKVGDLPSLALFMRLTRLLLSVVAANYVLVPVTSLCCVAFRGIGTYLLVGMGWFLTYIGLGSWNYNYLVPACIPARLTSHCMTAGFLSSTDLLEMGAVSTSVFLLGFILCAYGYSKSEAV